MNSIAVFLSLALVYEVVTFIYAPTIVNKVYYQSKIKKYTLPILALVYFEAMYVSLFFLLSLYLCNVLFIFCSLCIIFQKLMMYMFVNKGINIIIREYQDQALWSTVVLGVALAWM